MVKGLRAVLYTIAAAALLLGLWGALSNAAVPLIYGQREWDFFQPFEKWGWEAHQPQFRFPWWAISWQTPCPYLDPYLAGPVGYGFYALCAGWGLGTLLMLRGYARADAGQGGWAAFLFGAWWLIGLGGIIAHVAFFASIAAEAKSAGLCP